MKIFKIEYWFRYGVDCKDFDVEVIEANSFTEAICLLKVRNPSIYIFKTTMLPI